MEEIDLWDACILASAVLEVDYFGSFVNARIEALWKDGICLTVVENKCRTLRNGADRCPREQFFIME